MQTLPLIDQYSRTHNSLRLSVTDRCNIRCFYCMPEETIRFLPKKHLLTFEEIESLVRILAKLGIDKIRLTGGEPLIREQVASLVRMLKQIPGITEVAMTTNAVLLKKYAKDLKEAGLDRLNISLDSLDQATYQKITRRDVLQQALQGIQSAKAEGFPIRLNALAIKGMTESEVVPLAQFALDNQMELRFIEYMPLDFDRRWKADQVLSADDILRIIGEHFGPTESVPRPDPSQPAQDFLFANGKGRLGLIHPVSRPFCSACNRIRLTAEGGLRNCLFSDDEWDLKTPLRNGAAEQEMETLIRDCVTKKWQGHNIGKTEFKHMDKSMHQIGG